MKKKFTMLFAALLACVGVMAQAYDGVYTIGVDENIQRGYVAAGVGYDEYPVLSGITLDGYTGNDTESIENGKNWYITSVDEGTTYYIYNVALGKFLVGGDVINFGDTPYTWSFSANGVYVNIKDVTVEKFLSGGCGRPAANRPIAYDTNINDGGAKHTITAVDGGETTFATQIAAADAAIQALVNSVVDMVYVYKYGETEWGRETIEAKKGEAYPAPAARYGVTYTLPEGNVAADAVDGTEVEINCSLSGELPFQFATDYNSIEHWYYLNIRDSEPTYMYYDSSVEYIKATESSVPDNSKDAYTWAFVGNPFAGFSIVNYAAGETMVLSAPTAPTGDKNAAELARMVAKDGATGNLVWTILKPTHTDRNPAPVEGSFYVQHPTATTYAFNRQDYNSIKTVCYWSQRDTGSDLQVVERPIGPVAELAALIEEIEAAGIVCGTNPGEYTEASVNNLNAAVATAKTVGSSATESDLNALQAAYDALDVNPITAGKYIIVNAKPAFDGGKVLTAYAKCTYNGTHNTPAWTDKNLNDPLQYWTVEIDGDNCYLKAAYEGSYVTSVSKLGDEPKAATFTWLAPGQYNISVGDGVFHANLHNWANTSSSNIIGYAGGADSPSAWKLVTVSEEPEFTLDLAVGEVGYATLMLAYNATIPTGATCYTAAVDGEYVKLTEVEGNVLPAKTPVIVAAEANTYSFVSTTATAAVSAENELVGSLYPQIVTPDANTTCYVLAKPAAEEGEEENPVGFYKAALNQSDNAAFLNNANKVYLPVAAGAEAPAMFSFGRGEGTTGIETAVSGEQTVVIYDLAGRRVEKMEKGIYIVNGKKVIR